MFKKITQLLFSGGILTASLLSLSQVTFAAEGDTTTVISHHTQKLSWWENYDSTATFPDGSLSYRKIFMEFELGKYLCDGYDPDEPGEPSSGGTGWCADWDYDVHVIAMTATGDTVELGELITPYANSTFPAVAGWDWKHPYIFDVTDYYSILKDVVTIRIFYAGYSGGFTSTLKFHFIEGTRAKDVVGIGKMYHGSYAYGMASDPIEDKVNEKSLTIPTGATQGVFRTIISGHGGISGSNCSEFCSKWLKYKVNGADILTKDIWRDDCGSNWLAVQSGTWVYDRANWCPGNAIEPWIVKMPSSAFSGSSINADIDFEPFTASGAGASYKMSTYAIFYGDYNHDLDAGLEAINIPNSFVENRHSNPACGEAKIKVKNYGSTTITSIKIAYKIGTGAVTEKTFTTSLAADESAEFIIPDYALNSIVGENTFTVEIINVNGSADEDAFNNKLSTQFIGAPIHTDDYYNIQLKTSSRTSSTRYAEWKLINVETGAVLYTRKATNANVTFNDSFRLKNGCYKIVMSTPEGLGLAFFGAFSGKGYCRLFKTLTGTKIPMPGNDMGSTTLEGNFGNGFTYYFSVNSPNSIETNEDPYFVTLYPNPAQDVLNIEINTLQIKDASVSIINNLGQVVWEQSVTDKKFQINTQSLSTGLYTVIIKNNGQSKIEKVSILK